MSPCAWARALIVVVPGLLSCAAGSSIAKSDGGVDAGTGGTGDGDAGALTGDAIPTAAVSFFRGGACPEGWTPYLAADGRFIVPTVATAPGGVTSGKPLASGEDRTHTHDLSATFTLGSTSYVGVAGGGNGGVTSDGAVMLATTTDAASTGLPYVQLLACRKNAAPVPRPTPLPRGMQMFFDMAACPDGWKQADATQGRLIVGLPQGAPQDVTFGGPPLSSVDGGADLRTHTHTDTATLTTTPHGIALASGCCGNGYGADGTYMATMDTGASEPGLPMIQLLACEKQ